MYETEANVRVESASQIPKDGIAGFGGLAGKIVARTVLPWSEHCTECVWPTCYTSCDLYSPREDGRCRRFVDGMVRIDAPNAVNGYLLKIRFKQWGKLWTPGSLNLRPLARAAGIETRDRLIGTALYQIPMPKPVRKLVVGKRYSLKKRLATRLRPAAAPTAFVAECHNPSDRVIHLSLTIRSFRKEDRIPFQKLLPLQPGFQLIRVPVEEIAANIDLKAPFNIELIPNDIDQELTLYFGLMEFVREARPPAVETPQSPGPEAAGAAKSDAMKKAGTIKCVVWDLDHTLWDGVLVEDGPAKLTLKPGIRAIVEELDRRGILQSVASKNNHDEATALLKQLRLDEFFLYPQISWNPKGEAVKTIARRLNIGVDTLLFVDDQSFERRQVEAVCPGVKALDAADYLTLPEREDCRLPVTAESAARRKMYLVERERQEIQENFQDDYMAFLKHCNIRLTVSPLTIDNLERVHELTQRTNQMNFSGSRYDRAVLRGIIDSPHLDTYVLACEDRFGSYGIVGFGMVDNRGPRLTDLMFSCRIQSKRVEHAFLRSTKAS